ncbi:hypothetical protein PVT71_27495 (plasmid) [Salipiger sp. H15]|uniref:Uncharacterized protein n=1 Tax=Alloyangia sp. H15 TaxID=3029062 RepID=A0AAU8ARM7_9RHOB
MQLYPASIVFLAILALFAVRGAQNVLMLMVAMIPFGMFSVVGLPSVGGLSLLAVNLCAATLIGLGSIALVARLIRGDRVPIEPATLILALFAIYTVFSATVLVRLFQGDLMVFALSRGATGVKVSIHFSWEKVWLGPSNSNISQTLYVLIACGLFVIASHVLARHGTAFGVRCLAFGAGLNVLLGAMDLLALDPLLSIIRTAGYSLSNEATVNGVPRVIGGFSEASSFGAASSMFCAFFATASLRERRLGHAALALANGGFTLMALSSTGIISLGVTCLVLGPQALAAMPRRVSRKTLILAAAGLFGITLTISGMLLFTTAPDMIGKVVQNLVLDKSQSSSGMERTAWAMGGLEALRDTWGLGAGTGSLRSNGLIFVLLGSVGLIGTAAFLAFLWAAFGGRASEGQASVLSSARVAALACLTSMLLASTVPDPGVPLIFLAALAVAAKAPRGFTGRSPRGEIAFVKSMSAPGDMHLDPMRGGDEYRDIPRARIVGLFVSAAESKAWRRSVARTRSAILRSKLRPAGTERAAVVFGGLPKMLGAA